jgi:hypothetical protein
MESVADMSDCIQWHMSIRPNGYGQTFYNGKVIRAHQKVWFEANGPVPKGMVIDHICHTEAVELGECAGGITCKHRACVNLDHLRLITHRENIMAGVHNRDNRTTCPKGHPNTPENTMIRKNGHRECAECNRIRARATWARKKELTNV